MIDPLQATCSTDERTGHCWSVIVKAGPRWLARYVAQGAIFKPRVESLFGPQGQPLLANAPSDHVHHHGLWFGFDEVNGHNLWSENHPDACGCVVSNQLMLTENDQRRVSFTDQCTWRSPSGDPLLDDQRTLTFIALADGEALLDVELTLIASHGAVTIGQTKEGGLPHLRVADSMDVFDGGKITNSEGQINEAECFGQSARWCDYSGPASTGGWAGISYLDHPSNPAFPSKWFTRDYGPLAPNFIYFNGPLCLSTGVRYGLRSRLYIHGGRLDDEKTEAQFKRYQQE